MRVFEWAWDNLLDLAVLYRERLLFGVIVALISMTAFPSPSSGLEATVNNVSGGLLGTMILQLAAIVVAHPIGGRGLASALLWLVWAQLALAAYASSIPSP